ncbi:MAG: endonuclease/exonuclease/phosphatase family protein [Bacteroidota bacterium]|nr:endonuclease/exonuclease/phosphatase family protein [Bacteroidota bacterium]
MERRIFLKGAMLLSVMASLFLSCEQPATSFDEVEKAASLEKSTKVTAPSPDSTIQVMTWNMRFGIGRGPWFGDACGYKVVYSEDDILDNLQLIAERINEFQPDILLLQEVDLNSTRSAYVDQLKWLMDNTYFNYAVYGSQWKAQFIPSDGLGRMHEVNAILSRWPLKAGERVGFPLRNDQSSVERYFYERCCLVKAIVEIPGFQEFYAISVHTTAFARDDSKHRHLIAFKEALDQIDRAGSLFVAGGDLNEIPPGSDSTDFCIENKCPGESFHHPGDDPMHKDGQNYTPEMNWLVPLYTDYKNVISLDDYLANQSAYFTQTPVPDHKVDRTLDYIFTNGQWKPGSGVAHQECSVEADHMPVSGLWILHRK